MIESDMTRKDEIWWGCFETAVYDAALEEVAEDIQIRSSRD